MCAESQLDLGTLVLIFTALENTAVPEQKELYRAYLQIAVFCEKVLHEADGVISLIRVVDRFTVHGTTPEMGNHVLHFTIVILFKAGFLRGKQKLHIRPISPQKAELPAMEIPTLFEGDEDRGSGTIAQMDFVVNEEGLYWFDVHLNDELVTRMPLRVIYQQIATPMGGLGQ